MVKLSTRDKSKDHCGKIDGKSSKMLPKMEMTLMQRLLKSLNNSINLITCKSLLQTKFLPKTSLMSIEKE